MSADENREGCITNQGSLKIEECDDDKDTIWYRIRPPHVIDFDSETGEFFMSIELPGVPKDKVNFKVLPELYVLQAPHEHTLYQLTEYFPYLASVDSIQANYENGLLSVRGRFKDRLENAVTITLK